MFKVHLKLISLITDLGLDIPLTIKIRKQQWHFPLVENVEAPLLDVERCFEINEEEKIDSTFQIQIISKINKSKAKLIGSAIIDIKEYPMDTIKTDRIRIGSHVWLDIELSYNYVSQRASQSIFESAQLENLETADVLSDQKQKNVWLKSEIQNLSHILNKTQRQYQDQLLKNSKLKQARASQERQFFSKQMKMEQQHEGLSYKLHQTNYTLTAIINLVYSHGDIQLINGLNDVLCRLQTQKKSSDKTNQSREQKKEDISHDMLQV